MSAIESFGTKDIKHTLVDKLVAEQSKDPSKEVDFGVPAETENLYTSPESFGPSPEAWDTGPIGEDAEGYKHSDPRDIVNPISYAIETQSFQRVGGKVTLYSCIICTFAEGRRATTFRQHLREFGYNCPYEGCTFVTNRGDMMQNHVAPRHHARVPPKDVRQHRIQKPRSEILSNLSETCQ